MTNELAPRVGQWYTQHDSGEMFRIVATDAATGNVAIQYFDGNVAEIERDTWQELDVEVTAAPEDWCISLRAHRPAVAAWPQPRADVERDPEAEMRLVWRVIASVRNVSWPSGLDRLH